MKTSSIVILIAVVVNCDLLLSQSIDPDAELAYKYWLYRERLRTGFMVVGGFDGNSIPAERRYENGNSSLHWGDGNLYLGHYIYVLATEYTLMNEFDNSDIDKDRTLTELYYAMQAINRLDVAYSTPLDGYLRRDDIPSDFVAQPPIIYPELSNPSVFNPYPVSTPDANGNNAVMTRDQYTHLTLGLASVIKSDIPSGTVWFWDRKDNNHVIIYYDFKQAAEDIWERMIKQIAYSKNGPISLLYGLYGNDPQWCIFSEAGTLCMIIGHNDAWSATEGYWNMTGNLLTGAPSEYQYSYVPLCFEDPCNGFPFDYYYKWDKELYDSRNVFYTWPSSTGYPDALRLVQACINNDPLFDISRMNYFADINSWTNYYQMIRYSLNTATIPGLEADILDDIDDDKAQLLLAPNCGPAWFDTLNNLVRYNSPSGWRADDKFVKEAINSNNGVDIGFFNGLDYMAYYNAYLLTKRKLQDNLSNSNTYFTSKEVPYDRMRSFQTVDYPIPFGDNIPYGAGSKAFPSDIIAYYHIEAVNTIKASADVKYRAKDYVLLLPSNVLNSGFHAESGSDFLATIEVFDTCSGPVLGMRKRNPNNSDGSVYNSPPERYGNSISEYQTVHIYPNPTSGIFTVELTQNSQGSLSVFDGQGHIVRELSFNSESKLLEIDIASERDGIYFVRIVQGGDVYSNKLVKRR